MNANTTGAVLAVLMLDLKSSAFLQILMKAKKSMLVLLGFVLAISLSFNAYSQKLPKVQYSGIRAPSNIKIDGKVTEWNDQFQAYNPINRIYYIISNDDENLYLAIRTGDGGSGEKAIFGITFNLQLPGENGKSSRKNINIRYPKTVEVQKSGSIRNAVNAVKRIKDDTSGTGKKTMDSLRHFANQKMKDIFKEIDVTGIKDIKDASISEYNIEGIRVAAQFDQHMQYTYELELPLKYLGSNINNKQKFKYNIKMNGLPEKAPGSPFAPPVIYADRTNFMAPEAAFLMYPTDFSGEYSLAKK